MYAGFQRVVEPHLLGENTAGHDVLVAWLVSGHSKSDPHPGWRNYLVANMSNAEILGEQFDEPRKGYKEQDPRIVRIHCKIPARVV